MIVRRYASQQHLAYLVGLLLAVPGCSGNPISKSDENLRKVPVKTVVVAQAAVQRTTLQPASVHAYYQAEIRAKASGFVKEIVADIGDVVEAGAPLAVIDVPEMQKRREILEAQIRRLAAEVKRSEAGVNLAKATIQSANASLAEAQSEMNRVAAKLAASQAEFQRTEDLVGRGALQDRMLDEARMRRDSELASQQAVASSIASAEAEVAVAEAGLISAEADLTAAQAETEIMHRQVEELDILLDFAVLKAPFAGVVAERNIDPGDLVRESNEVGLGAPLFVISHVDKVRIRIPVPEVDAVGVQPGDSVTLTFPSRSTEPPIQTTITRCSGSLDPSTRTMMVEVDLLNTDLQLLPGMFGQASILMDEKAANLLPSQAIRFSEEGNAFVYVVQSNATVSIANITTGFDDGKRIEVLSGVEPGQRVIDSHLRRFIDGQQVNVLAN